LLARTPRDGEPETSTLRVSHGFRREAREWPIVHRHGDYPPVRDEAMSAS
jgi:ketosteroid isomerase-like protein